MGNPEKLIVVIDKDLADIVPGYLNNRQNDVVQIPQALAQENFHALQIIGHRMKGSGAGYGFDRISKIGLHLEEAAKARNVQKMESLANELDDYLDRIEIIYE